VYCREAKEEDAGVEKPLLGRNEAAGHSKACEAGLVGVLTSLSRATEALPLSQRETYVGAASLAVLAIFADIISIESTASPTERPCIKVRRTRERSDSKSRSLILAQGKQVTMWRTCM